MSDIPIKPVNGKVLVRPLVYKPSKTIEIVSIDRADENEGIVEAVSEFRFAKKIFKKKGITVFTGNLIPHEVKVGDRVIFPGKYLDDDRHNFNGVAYRIIDADEIIAIVEKPQPEGFENAITGERTPDHHPLLIR